MKAGMPSATALRAGIARARHQLIDGGRVFKDPLALPILGRALADEIRRDPRAENFVSRALRVPLVARSRLSEDTMLAAIERGVQQVVVLGAGLDTFAYRRPAAAAGARVFEVDHPDTQLWKREQLEEAGIAVPPTVRYVPVDFERDELTVALRAGGFDPALPAVFSWLGVVVYLPKDVVMRTLRTLRALGAPGSVLVFDYVNAPGPFSLHRRAVLAFLSRRFARLGEPWRSFHRATELARELHAMGYVKTEDLQPADILRQLYQGHEAEVAHRRGGRQFGGVMRAWM